MTDVQLLDRVKTALRIKTDVYDEELKDLIASAKTDLEIAGVVVPEPLDAVTRTAIVTYVKIAFGLPDDAQRLKKSYDEQKAKLVTATDYTRW